MSKTPWWRLRLKGSWKLFFFLMWGLILICSWDLWVCFYWFFNQYSSFLLGETFLDEIYLFGFSLSYGDSYHPGSTPCQLSNQYKEWKLGKLPDAGINDIMVFRVHHHDFPKRIIEAWKTRDDWHYSFDWRRNVAFSSWLYNSGLVDAVLATFGNSSIVFSVSKKTPVGSVVHVFDTT